MTEHKPERTQYLPFGKPDFSRREVDAISKVLHSGWIGMGEETLAFERELAVFLNVPRVVSVNSCTSALFLSLLAHDIGPGDEVICPSLTWCSTANAALYLGAKPVFCDIDADTLCITAETVRDKLSSSTRAVIPVHFGGLCADIKGIRAEIPPHVVIIEDAAHAFGARFEEGQPVGSSANLTCFSFYANKNLSTGEGGAIALADAEMAEKLRSLRQHGMPTSAWNRFKNPKALRSSILHELGYKMNYTDLQACIGRVQLARQQEFHTIRVKVAQAYAEGLKSIVPSVKTQKNILHPYHARHLFVIRLHLERLTLSRDEVVLALRAYNIGASIHYTPLHTMPLYKQDKTAHLPVTESVCERNLTLPVSASMKVADAEYVIRQLATVFQSHERM